MAIFSYFHFLISVKISLKQNRKLVFLCAKRSIGIIALDGCGGVGGGGDRLLVLRTRIRKCRGKEIQLCQIGNEQVSV